MSRFTGSAYQYLQQSKIATDKFQKSLLRLKIPKLDKTCSRYLAALDPVLGDQEQYKEQYEQTKKNVGIFQKGIGQQLHSKLLQYDKSVKHTSYINKFWFDMYLSSRVPLPLNFNPFMAWKDDSRSELNDSIIKSTNFLISSMRFKKSLEDNLLEPEIFHLNPKKTANSDFYKTVMSMTPQAIATYTSMLFQAFPLDMSQYKNLFNSTRIPQIEKDSILKSDPKSNRHILVLRGGRFYTFDLLDSNGNIYPPERIYSCLKYIKELPVPEKSDSITELTTANRDLWARERQHLVGLSDKNSKNLSKIDSALFVLCLDDLSFTQEQELDGAHNFLHGANSNKTLNRWFDKSLSVMMTHDGHAAINFEHSWGDGVAVLRYFTEIFADTTKNPQFTSRDEVRHIQAADSDLVRTLDFDLDDRLQESVRKCRQDHLDVTNNLELNAVKYTKLDRNYFKTHKLSPDSMIQLSFQLAYYRLFEKTPVSYESCSTAAFRGGRTETVRPATNETKLATNTILSNRKSSKIPHEELKNLLAKCSAKHYQLCKEASMGEGFDRHLFAMKEIALRNNMKLPELYQDPIYSQSQHFELSTSTLYGDSFSGGGFGPVVEDGFGLGYGYVDASFGVLVSNYKGRKNGVQFSQALQDSLDDIRKIVEVSK